MWIEPEVSLAESYAVTASELKEPIKVVETNKDVIGKFWNEYFAI